MSWLTAIRGLVNLAFVVYEWLIIIRILLSWFRLPSGGYFYPVIKFIYEITEPYLGLFRRIVPPVMAGAAGIDFSPIVAILVLRLLHSMTLVLLDRFVLQLLFTYL